MSGRTNRSDDMASHVANPNHRFESLAFVSGNLIISGNLFATRGAALDKIRATLFVVNYEIALVVR